MEFEVDAWAQDDAVCVRLHGELDLAALPGLRAAIHAAVTTPARSTVIVDLRKVTFLDCSALGELVRGHTLALDRGLRYQVVEAHGLPLQVMALTGALPLLTADESA